MKKGIFAQLGKRGLNLELLKIKTRKGKKSGTKIGNKKTITLACPIIIGCPIYRIREVVDGELRRGSLKVENTSRILGIMTIDEMNDGLTFKFKTENSVYIGRFIEKEK